MAKKKVVSYENEYVHLVLGTEAELGKAPDGFPEEILDAYICSLYVNMKYPEVTTSVHINQEILLLIVLAELELTINKSELIPHTKKPADPFCTIQTGWSYYIFSEDGEKVGERVGLLTCIGQVHEGPFKDFFQFFIILPYDIRKKVNVSLAERCEAARIQLSSHTGRFDLPLRDCPIHTEWPPWLIMLKPLMIPFIVILVLVAGYFLIVFATGGSNYNHKKIPIEHRNKLTMFQQQRLEREKAEMAAKLEEESKKSKEKEHRDDGLRVSGGLPVTMPEMPRVDSRLPTMTPDSTIAPKPKTDS